MTAEKRELSRRTFLESSVGLSLGSAAIATSRTPAIQGANDRIRIGFIGVGNRGTQLLTTFQSFRNVEIAALCDVYEPYLARDRSRVDRKLIRELGGLVPPMDEGLGDSVLRFKDFRALLDVKDLDAVVIATPDHWHAIQTIQACEAGKDVYVEKPLTITIREGRRMVEAAQRHNRIVQVGLQRRSSKLYREIREKFQEGAIGRVTVSRAYRISNMSPSGIGRSQPSAPPPDLDWDFWLGPQAWREYQDNIHPYRFRWWGGYSSQIGNWGVHYFDAIRWVIGEKAPVSISAHGGKFAVQDDRTIPDTMEVIFEFAKGSLLIFGQYEAAGGPAIDRGEIEIRGTLGNVIADVAYNRVVDYRIEPSPGGQFQPPDLKTEALQKSIETGILTHVHVGNFLECLRTRKECNCPLEEGHRSTTFAHLANIAVKTGSRIDWDPEKETITNNAEANRLLHYEYRPPWKLA